MDYKNEIIKMLKSMSGRYTEYQIFSDWVEMTAISFRNSCHLIHDAEWKRWEKQYLDIAGRYSGDELNQMGHMTAFLTLALEESMEDVLGEVFMLAGLGSTATGQFFTPFNISDFIARMNMADVVKDLPEGEHIRIHEPSSGAGGMIIAACRALHEMGFDYQRHLDAICQDLDWRAVYMTYLQLSLIGCRAVVVQGNTLTEPYHVGYPRERCMETPALMGLIV